MGDFIGVEDSEIYIKCECPCGCVFTTQSLVCPECGNSNFSEE